MLSRSIIDFPLQKH